MASVKFACLLLSVAMELPAYGQNLETPASTSTSQPGKGAISGGANQSEIDDVSAKIDKMLKTFKPLELPPEPTSDHELNRSLSLSPLRQSDLIPLASMRPVRLEASFT